MLSPLRNRFGIPGVISVIALVFAMFGGAYAASNSGGNGPKASASAKGKPGPPGKRGKPGPPGPAGPQGPAGPAGAKGDTGAAGSNGKNGTNGTNGKTVLNGTTTPTGAVGTDGDFYIETDVSKIYGPKAGGTWPAGVDLKGKEGSPWTAGGTLPKGKTETGMWSANSTETNAFVVLAPISFAIPLAAEIGESNVHYVTVTTPNPNCTGTADAPTAASGHLCVYLGTESGGFNGKFFTIGDLPVLEPGAGVSGAYVEFLEVEEPAYIAGSWAVTAS